MRYVYISLGTLSLGLGILGIVTPGLPTTPFILLTGFLYAKGSPRLHEKLKTNKLTGRYLNRMKEGVSTKMKIFSILFMWCMISFTVFVVFANNITMQHVMVGLGVLGTISQLLVLRKKRKKVEILIPSEVEDDKPVS